MNKSLAYNNPQILFEETKKLFPIEEIQNLNKDEVVKCQSMLGHGNRFGFWRDHPDFIGKNKSSSIDIIKTISSKLPQEILNKIYVLPYENNTEVLEQSGKLPTIIEQAVLWLTRWALLCRLGPVGSGRIKGQPLSPTTIVSNIKMMSRIISYGIQNRINFSYQTSNGFIEVLTEMIGKTFSK